jgi:D-alanine transaminase
MSNYVHVNGAVVPYDKAFIHIEDRGFQFSDGIYEVVAVRNRCLVDSEPHFQRLDRSLRELEIPSPMSHDDLRSAIHELIERNALNSGTIYIQITRGVAPRQHAFPDHELQPTVVITTKSFQFPEPEEKAFMACKVITVPDMRWGRRDIKSISLLANCMAMTQANRVGAFEAVQYDQDGFVTEGSASNAWIVTFDGEIWTRNLDQAILPGICRKIASSIAKGKGLTLREKRFTTTDLKKAREVFLTTTTPMVKPVGTVDDVKIGDGTVGPVTRDILTAYRERVFSMESDT